MTKKTDVDFEKKLKESFVFFLYVVWKHLKLPKPTKIQNRIAIFLQYGPPRMIIEGFRGVGKSWITSAFVLWLLFRDPNLRIEVVSASMPRAIDFSTFTQRLIYEVPILKRLIPSKAKGARVSRINFDVGGARAAHAPSVKSVGITGQITGTRADIIIADDVEIPNNSATQDSREKLLKAVGEFNSILKPNGRIIYLGTPQTEESIYNVLGQRNFIRRIYPVMYPALNKIPFYEGCLDPEIEEEVMTNHELVGKPTDPDRFNEYEIEARRVAYGNSEFILQFMLDTSLSDADKYPLRTSDLIVLPLVAGQGPSYAAWGTSREQQITDLHNVGFNGDRWFRPFKVSDEWQPFEHSVMSIDPSGKGADETGIAVVKSLNGSLFLTKSVGYTDGYSPETLDKIAKLAKEQEVCVIIIEDNFGGGMFGKLLEPYLIKYDVIATIETTRATTQKEVRIVSTLEPVMNQHKLIVAEDVVRDSMKEISNSTPNVKEILQYNLFYQMTRLTKERGALKHDDKLDALEGAVRYLIDYVNRDAAIEVEKYRDKVRDEELDRLLEELGTQRNPSGPPTFMDEYMF